MTEPYLTEKSGNCIVCGKSFTFWTKTRYVRSTCGTKCAHTLQVSSIKTTGGAAFEYLPSPEEIAEKAAAIKARNLQRMKDEVRGWQTREYGDRSC